MAQVRVTNLMGCSLEGAAVRAACSAALSPFPAAQTGWALPPLPPREAATRTLPFTLDAFGEAKVHLQVRRHPMMIRS